MKKPLRFPALSLLALLTVTLVPPAPNVGAASPLTDGMMWVATANWLECNQQSEAPECAEFTTPLGSVMMTCCVATSALGTSDLDACDGDGMTRGRDEL